MPTENSFALQALTPAPSKRAIKRARKALKLNKFSAEEQDRRDEARSIELAYTRAMVRATREVPVDRGVVWYDDWAQLARRYLGGFQIREARLEDGFRTNFGVQLQDRLIQRFADFGRCTAENTWWRGQLCVRAYLRVPVTKLQLRVEDVTTRRYFDEET